jgi:hypothetical protein
MTYWDENQYCSKSFLSLNYKIMHTYYRKFENYMRSKHTAIIPEQTTFSVRSFFIEYNVVYYVVFLLNGPVNTFLSD